jgi:hypothetical protein
MTSLIDILRDNAKSNGRPPNTCSSPARGLALFEGAPAGLSERLRDLHEVFAWLAIEPLHPHGMLGDRAPLNRRLPGQLEVGAVSSELWQVWARIASTSAVRPLAMPAGGQPPLFGGSCSYIHIHSARTCHPSTVVLGARFNGPISCVPRGCGRLDRLGQCAPWQTTRSCC